VKGGREKEREREREREREIRHISAYNGLFYTLETNKNGKLKVCVMLT
jgi:hypothetical protein